MRKPWYITTALVIGAVMVGAIVCNLRRDNDPTDPTPEPPQLRRRAALSSWAWPVLYLACGVAVVLAFVYEPQGYSSILQILGTLITVISLWATIMIRTSTDRAAEQWEQPFSWMIAVGGMLIAIGIYSDAVEKFDALWQFGLGISIIVVWLIIIWFAVRTIR